MRSVLGGSRTRSVLGGDDENEMQCFDLDGDDIEQEGEEERKKRKLDRRDLDGGDSTIWAGQSLALDYGWS